MENFWERLWSNLSENPLFLLDALKNTLIIALCGFVIGLLIGTAIAVLGTYPKPNLALKCFNKIGGAYILLIRGTPVVVQLLLLYFVLLAPLQLPALTIAVVAFGLNSGAYLAETLRGAIQAIDKGQTEAGRALGLSHWQTMKNIVLPQAYKNTMPQFGNEIVTLVKETSVVGFITVIDITRASQLLVAKTYDAVAPYVMLALIYLAVVYLLTAGIKLLEKRMIKYE